MTERIFAPFEIKSVSGGRTIVGYANTYAGPDANGDVVAPGAFRRTLVEKTPSQVGVFIGHNSSMLPVGIPLVIKEDECGLYTETKVFRTTGGDDLLATARELQAAGQPLGMSIGFQTRDSQWAKTADGQTFRKLTDIDLMEYSFAASQVIANSSSLVLGVKRRAEADHHLLDRYDADPWRMARVGAVVERLRAQRHARLTGYDRLASMQLDVLLARLDRLGR